MNKTPKEKVYLKKIDKEVTLDFFSLNDDQWVADHIGEEAAQEAFTTFKNETIILKMFWNQLTSESKRIIASVKITRWEGLEEKELSFSEPDEKLQHIVSGADELIAIWNAVISTKRKSMPQAVENLKKKVMEEESSQKQK